MVEVVWSISGGVRNGPGCQRASERGGPSFPCRRSAAGMALWPPRSPELCPSREEELQPPDSQVRPLSAQKRRFFPGSPRLCAPETRPALCRGRPRGGGCRPWPGAAEDRSPASSAASGQSCHRAASGAGCSLPSHLSPGVAPRVPFAKRGRPGPASLRCSQHFMALLAWLVPPAPSGAARGFSSSVRCGCGLPLGRRDGREGRSAPLRPSSDAVAIGFGKLRERL